MATYMEDFFLDLFQTHFEVFKQFGYLIIFGVTFVESIPLVGMLIPGQTMIILAGFLVKLHIFGFWLAVIIGSLGALLGDFVGFLLGRKYGRHFTDVEQRFYIKKEQFQKTMDLIVSNPFKTIFFGRLHSLTRTLTPFAGGASGITLRKFLAIDILSSFVWAFLSILIGFIFGKSFEKASTFIGGFILIATIVTIVIIIIVNYAKKKKIPISNNDVFILISSAISIYLFSLIAQNLHKGQLFSIFDTRIFVLKDLVETPILTYVMIAFTSMGSAVFLISISLLFIIYLIWKKRNESALLFTTVLSTGYMFVLILKSHFDRIRPEGLVDVSGSSFPSGHSAMTMMFVVLLTYIILRNIKNTSHKNILITIAFATSILIGISRIYLGVHFASDVLAGLLFGIFWATFGIVILKAGKFIIRIARQKHQLPLP
jgi:undecaprenyl-diphosphatase